MSEIDRLLAEHAQLRRDAAALGDLIGPQLAVGWEDHSDCDLTRFEAAREKLQRDLLDHENREERYMARRLRADGPPDIEREIERSHETLNRMMSLLHSVSVLCTEGRVHALRVVCTRVSQELGTHLAYEEEVLFPLLQRAEKAAASPRRPRPRARP